MRTGAVVVGVGMALFGIGCSDKESMDPGFVLREESARSAWSEPRAAPSGAASRVRCACDADGGLHVLAPPGSRVVRTQGHEDDADAEIVLPDAAPEHLPLRRTKSLGFIGDGKLGASRTRGGPWAVPDALLPPHSHGAPHYGGYGPAPYGHGHPSYGTYGRSWSTSWH